jgi:thiol-disulfide isomerase/thioredoxin
MRLNHYTLLWLISACAQSRRAEVSPQPERTATDFSTVNLSDTIEDPAYASAGEQLAKTAGALLVGKAAPLAVLNTIDGETIDLANVYGAKPVYIKFWATWCTPCRQQMPAFQQLYKTLGDQIQFVALNIGLSDDLASIRRFRETYGITMPVVVDDGRLAQLFNLRVTPQHVLIGRDARIAYFGHADNQALAESVQRVLNQPISRPPVRESGPSAQLVQTPSDLTVTTTSGARVSLTTATPGRLRGVVLFSSWCEWYLATSRPATARACAARRLAVEQLAGVDRGVDWIGVAGGPWATTEDLASYQQTHKVTIPLALDSDGSVFRHFEIRDIPTVILLDRGHIVRTVGPDDGELAAAISALRPR